MRATKFSGDLTIVVVDPFELVYAAFFVISESKASRHDENTKKTKNMQELTFNEHQLA